MPRLLIFWFSILWSSMVGHNLADTLNKTINLNLIIKDHLTNIEDPAQCGTRAVVVADNSCSGPTYEAQYDYYPYGKVLRKVENPRSRFQSTDHETDLETGYNNRNARWYDDESFSFLGCDPMQTTYPSWSPYHYVGRNPISILDPTGMNWYKSNNKSYTQYIWFDGDGEREGYTNLGESKTLIGKKGDNIQYTVYLKPDGTALYVPSIFWKQEIIGPGISGITPAGSFITTREKTDGEALMQNCPFEAYISQFESKRNYYKSGALGEPPTNLFEMMISARSVYTLGSAIYSANATKVGGQGGLNLFKWGAEQTGKSTGWKTGDYMLHLPNKGTPALNWKANYGALRSEMNLGKPIFDSYRLPNGNLIPTGGFLNAERFTLQSRGWIYNPGQGAWLPPIR